MTQLRAAHPELEFVPIRGNVDTRLAKCESGVVDAVVLAAAGMKRLGVFERATHVLEPELCLPAVGQGALVIEHRREDSAMPALLAPLDHPDTRRSVSAERGLLAAVEGNCQLPVAGYAVRRGGDLWLRGMLAEPDGSRLRVDERVAPWPEDDASAVELGRRLGHALLARS